MPSKTLIGGTAYTIAGGRTLIGGTAYSIAQGKVMKGGTIYTIDMPHKNLVSTSVGIDGKTVFNSVGYANNTYLSLGASTTFPYHCHVDDTGCFTTGWIWMPAGTTTIYFKGAKWNTANGHCRLGVMHPSSLGTAAISFTIKGNGTSGTEAFSNYGTLTTLGTNYYKFTAGTSWINNVTNYDRWIAFSLEGSGSNFIVTFNQPIE